MAELVSDIDGEFSIPNLISAEWLEQRLQSNASTTPLVVLDASIFMPNVERDPQQEFIEARIPGARYFDFHNKIAAQDTDLPHMLPPPDLFEAEVGKLGISNDSHVIVYDSLGIFSSPRAWWMFKVMGHNKVSVLNGGLPAWLSAGFEVETGISLQKEPSEFIANLQPEWLIAADDLLRLLDSNEVTILDARANERFLAKVEEPRVGLRSGHIPNSKNLPFNEVLDNGYFIETDQLVEIFNRFSEPNQRLIFSCGSGVTACILALAASLTGRESLTVYDGSWSEWGANIKYPVVR